VITHNIPHFKTVVAEYCDAVLSGEIVTGGLVRGAVQRHVTDLRTAHERGWRFDFDKAERACAFFPLVLTHYKGEWAGEPFTLSPWQAFVTSCVFGWCDAQTGLRRFRKALISIARKNGKTAWAAGLELKQLYWDEPEEPAAEVYCVATKEDQAKLLYADALAMVEASIFLKGQSLIRRSPSRINYRRNNSFLKPLGSDSTGTDGLNPHCVVMDELHAWRERHRPLKEKLSTGGAARRQPLEIIITTAGDSDSLLWIEEDTYARSTIDAANQGKVFDDRFFAFVATLDPHDDPLDEKNWPKANPNLGVSVKVDYLRDQARLARNAPTLFNQFVRYHANSKTEANERAITADAWALGNRPLTIQPGDQCHGGIDLGRSKDFTAIALCFPRYTTGDDGIVTVERWDCEKLKIVSPCMSCNR
jgi:phage terminase large subunit-like protein